MQTKLNTLRRSHDTGLLGSIADELGVGKLTLKTGGKWTHLEGFFAQNPWQM